MIREASTNGINPMQKREMAILVAEIDPVQAASLARSLELLGCRPALADSAQQVLEMIRREIFRRALVAAELIWKGQPLLMRLDRLPSMQCLIATGPPGDTEMEMRARLSGADLYLPRPVKIESLVKALEIPAPSRIT